MSAAATALHIPDTKLAYRVDEAGAQLGYSRAKMWRLIKAGTIRTKKDGGCTIILRDELVRYLEAL